MHPHVLKDFSKDEAKTVDKLIDAVAGELPKLIAGDDGAFMSRIAFLMAPPKPPPKPKPPPEAAEEAPSAAPQDAETPE